MSRFLTPLRAERAGNVWTVLQPLIYESDVAQRVFIVPEGLTTDFASVPRLPLAFLLTGDCAQAAATIHDYAYRTAIVDRAMADKVFKEAAIASGEPAWRAALMYAGIRLGGWMAWNEHRSRELGSSTTP
jgi:hypothetical protein